jgi:hypothetical protein
MRRILLLLLLEEEEEEWKILCCKCTLLIVELKAAEKSKLKDPTEKGSMKE